MLTRAIVEASEPLDDKLLAFGEFCQAEVQDFHDAVLAHHDVLRLDVAMNDAGGVRGDECGGDLYRDVEHFDQLEVADACADAV